MVHISKYFGLLVVACFIAAINIILVDAIECGRVDLYHPAIIGGSEVQKDEWPFIAALYYINRGTFDYFCGGTIITNKHVLTAAHCIQMKGTEVPLTPGKIMVRLGAYNLTNRGEMDVVNRNVTQIFVHHDWKVNDDKYDADIAVLVLHAIVTFSNHIRPVCMPPRDFLIDGLVGTVVGWGKTENGTAEGTPKKLEVNALNDTYCYSTDQGIARYVSERCFCGRGNGTPNQGDSGGGFFAVEGSGWVQFGIVSFIRPKTSENTVKFAVYTKLTSVRDWVAQKVEESGGSIGVVMTEANLNCTYGYNSASMYACFSLDLNIRQESYVVRNITGSHHFDKGNDDVERITFESGVMASIPHNLGNIFRNLKELVVFVNINRISRSNLQNFERLEVLEFSNSSMIEFEENSLWDLSNLHTFVLDYSKLNFLQAGTFSKNYNLTTVRLWSNALLKSLPDNLFENNLLLDRVVIGHSAIEFIDEDFFKTNVKLRVVFLGGNRLRHLSENLFQNNFELEIIDLSENRIKTIDDQSFRTNRKLFLLQLDSNEVDVLPAKLLQGLEVLEQIHLERNSLEAIDEQFFETNFGMKNISLGANKLNRIPANIFRNNQRLEHIDLGRNYIDSIDGNIFEGNPLLQKVILGNNFLVELPWNLFRRNEMLDYIDVKMNFLQGIDERTFEWNTRLREIDFEFNLIAYLPTNLFHNNTLLEIIRFGGNFLETLDDRTFQTNFNLQTVYLNKNNLLYLPEKLFHNNSLLEYVQIGENPSLGSQSLPRNLFQGNLLLKYVGLNDNALVFIETDFTILKQVVMINLRDNICIDMIFIGNTRNLPKFQETVTARCSRKTI